MGSDMVVALPRATSNKQTVFGHNSCRPQAEVQTLRRKLGQAHPSGEIVALRNLQIPQARQTFTVIAGRPAGQWGYVHGVNENGIAVGLTRIRTRLQADGPGLEGHELTRLALERAKSARQAVDVITDLISRHGQGAGEGDAECDHAFLIVDGNEAFALETAAKHWAVQEVKEVRAVGGVCQLRQDWDRISRGLADLVIERGWWEEDGSKVDFAAAVGLPSDDQAAALRRWGLATLRLEEHNGQIDLQLMRRLLTGTEDGLCALPSHGNGLGTAASLIAELGSSAEEPMLVWGALGAPSSAVYFPITLLGELPHCFYDASQESLWRRLSKFQSTAGILHSGDRAMLAGLQIHYEQMAREFKTEAAELIRTGETQALERLATAFMEHAVERFVDGCASVAHEIHRTDAANLAIDRERASRVGSSVS